MTFDLRLDLEVSPCEKVWRGSCLMWLGQSEGERQRSERLAPCGQQCAELLSGEQMAQEGGH